MGDADPGVVVGRVTVAATGRVLVYDAGQTLYVVDAGDDLTEEDDDWLDTVFAYSNIEDVPPPAYIYAGPWAGWRLRVIEKPRS